MKDVFDYAYDNAYTSINEYGGIHLDLRGAVSMEFCKKIEQGKKRETLYTVRITIGTPRVFYPNLDAKYDVVFLHYAGRDDCLETTCIWERGETKPIHIPTTLQLGETDFWYGALRQGNIGNYLRDSEGKRTDDKYHWRVCEYGEQKILLNDVTIDDFGTVRPLDWEDDYLGFMNSINAGDIVVTNSDDLDELDEIADKWARKQAMTGVKEKDDE